jgi:hypothetical protein
MLRSIGEMSKINIRLCVSLAVFFIITTAVCGAWANDAEWKLKAEEEIAYVEIYSPMKTQLEYWLKGVPETEEGRSFKELCWGIALSDHRSPKRFDLEQFKSLYEQVGTIQNDDSDPKSGSELLPRVTMRAGEAFASVEHEGTNKISGET